MGLKSKQNQTPIEHKTSHKELFNSSWNRPRTEGDAVAGACLCTQLYACCSSSAVGGNTEEFQTNKIVAPTIPFM